MHLVDSSNHCSYNNICDTPKAFINNKRFSPNDKYPNKTMHMDIMTNCRKLKPKFKLLLRRPTGVNKSFKQNSLFIISKKRSSHVDHKDDKKKRLRP